MHYRGRGHGGNQAVAPGYNESPHIQQLQASLSYVTGSHNLKFGFQNECGQIDLYSADRAGERRLLLRQRRAEPVRQWATPIHTANKLSAEMGIYAQDAWTLKRATINMGLRFDYFAQLLPRADSSGRACSCRTATSPLRRPTSTA